MTRRSAAHDYTLPGIYHITMHVADGLGQPFGAVVGRLQAPADSADAPHVALTPLGQLVEHELLNAIPAHYPMVAVQDYVVMPEHLHAILKVSRPIVTKNGVSVPLGLVIAGFKKGCNRVYWALTGQTAAPAKAPAGEPLGTVSGGSPAANPAAVPTAVPAAAAAKRAPSSATTGRQPLFADGFCDVMPLDAAQLATQRQYIKDNPCSRLQRSQHRDWLSAHRGAVRTALTLSALRGYLQRECPSALIGPEVLAAIEGRLLLANDGFILCDSYGDRALLQHRLLPVVCHRKDTSRFAEQKAHCLAAAAQGAVLVSACISPKEREIIDEAVNHGFSVITILDNGFPDRFHPSAERQALCAAGRLLVVSPWGYHYRGNNEQVTVPFCKTMNCLAQAICRSKDSWWKINN